jgi:hypothetical protein
MAMKAWVLVIDFVDGADVGVIQGGGGFGFAFEAGQGLRVFGDVVGEEFQRDETAEFYVFGFIDNAHSSAAEFLDDAVVRNGLADHWRMPKGWAASSYGRSMCQSMNDGWV